MEQKLLEIVRKVGFDNPEILEVLKKLPGFISSSTQVELAIDWLSMHKEWSGAKVARKVKKGRKGRGWLQKSVTGEVG